MRKYILIFIFILVSSCSPTTKLYRSDILKKYVIKNNVVEVLSTDNMVMSRPVAVIETESYSFYAFKVVKIVSIKILNMDDAKLSKEIVSYILLSDRGNMEVIVKYPI